MSFHRLLIAVLCRTNLKHSEGVAEHEEFSMFSTLSTQGQDGRPTTHCPQGERQSMRLAYEPGESGWDNG